MAEAAPDAAPQRRSTSGPAIFGTLVAVAIAVLVGVLGPDLGRRGIAPEGVPLGAAVERLGEAHRTRIASDNVPIDRWRDAARSLGAIRVPEPTDDSWSYRGARIDDGSAEGVAGPGPVVVAAFERERPDGGGTVRLSIAAVADEGAFHRYDGFVRSRPLLDGEVLRFAGAETAAGVAVLVFVEDPIVWIVHCDDDEVLEKVTEELLGRPARSPAAPEATRVRRSGHAGGGVPGPLSIEPGGRRVESPILRS